MEPIGTGVILENDSSELSQSQGYYNYKELYENEKRIRFQLEQDCDLLALENVRLHNEIDQLKEQQSVNQFKSLNISTITDETTHLVAPQYKVEMILHSATTEQLTSLPSSPGLIIRADNSINMYTVPATLEKTITNDIMEKIWSHILLAPVTCMISSKTITMCGMFDGSIAIISFDDWISNKLSEPVVVIRRDHSMRILACEFASDGLLFATSSMDLTVNIYEIRNSNDSRICPDLSCLHKVFTLRFTTTPESLCFCPATVLMTTCEQPSVTYKSTTVTIENLKETSSSNFNETESITHKSIYEQVLVIGLRNCSSLVYFNCQTYKYSMVSLNERSWDDHASFTPLSLSVSPNNKFLAVASDKSYIVVYKLGTNERVSLLAEHTCKEFGKPSICWDNTSEYVYSNTDSDFDIYIYSLQYGKLIKKLKGHKGSVRNIKYASIIPMLLSCSFDKSIILWT